MVLMSYRKAGGIVGGASDYLKENGRRGVKEKGRHGEGRWIACLPVSPSPYLPVCRGDQPPAGGGVAWAGAAPAAASSPSPSPSRPSSTRLRTSCAADL